MTIITQENELLNYSAAVKRIAVFAASVEGENGGEIPVYTILAFDLNSEMDAETIDGAVQLGVFTREDECSNAFAELCSAIELGKSLYRMPQPQEQT